MKKFFVIIVIICSVKAKAQVPKSGLWVSPQVMLNFNKKWQWHNEGGYRTIGTSASAFQTLYRTGVRYFINDKWSATLGFALFYTRTNYEKANHEFGAEPRLWQELNYKWKLSNRFNIQNRLRTEERFFQATKTKAAYDAFRLRNKITGTWMINEKWGAQLSDEFMQQLDHGHFWFNQNRVIAAVVYQPDKTLQVQAGFLWFIRPEYNQDIATLTIQKTISLHGKKQ